MLERDFRRSNSTPRHSTPRHLDTRRANSMCELDARNLGARRANSNGGLSARPSGQKGPVLLHFPEIATRMSPVAAERGAPRAEAHPHRLAPGAPPTRAGRENTPVIPSLPRAPPADSTPGKRWPSQVKVLFWRHVVTEDALLATPPSGNGLFSPVGSSASVNKQGRSVDQPAPPPNGPSRRRQLSPGEHDHLRRVAGRACTLATADHLPPDHLRNRTRITGHSREHSRPACFPLGRVPRGAPLGGIGPRSTILQLDPSERGCRPDRLADHTPQKATTPGRLSATGGECLDNRAWPGNGFPSEVRGSGWPGRALPRIARAEYGVVLSFRAPMLRGSYAATTLRLRACIPFRFTSLCAACLADLLRVGTVPARGLVGLRSLGPPWPWTLPSGQRGLAGLHLRALSGRIARAFVDLAVTGAEWKLALSSLQDQMVPSPSWTCRPLSRVEQHPVLALSNAALLLPARSHSFPSPRRCCQLARIGMSCPPAPLPGLTRASQSDLSWDFQRSPSTGVPRGLLLPVPVAPRLPADDCSPACSVVATGPCVDDAAKRP